MDSKNPFFSRQSLFAKKPLICPHDPSLPTMQISSITDVNLANLRETIKNAMIPLLIKVFELKLAAQQAHAHPSPLENRRATDSIDNIQEQLSFLLKDLDLLNMWCDSSRKQVVKAIKEVEIMIHKAAYPQKSFNKISISSSSEIKEKRASNWLRKFFPW